MYQPEGRLWSATPADDQLCSQPYLGWRDPMALDLYGRANELTRALFVDAGRRLGVPQRAMLRMLGEVCSGVSTGVNRADRV